MDEPDAWHGIIDDVDSVTTGIDNVKLDVYTEANAKTEADTNGKITDVADKCVAVAYGAYALYDDDGYIIAAVTVADDGSTSDNWVYVSSGSVTREAYDANADEWTWSREVILDGVETEIHYKGDSIKYLDDMEKYNWYVVKYKGDGNVKSVKLAVNELDHKANGDTSFAGDRSGDKYEGNIYDLAYTVQKGKDTILYEAGTSYLDGKTFYVSTQTKTGFRVREDVKVVFIQTNDKKEKFYYEEGVSKLEDLVDDLNKGKKADENGGDYSYEISAVLDSNVARVVIIRDLNGSAKTVTPPPTPSGKYSTVVDETAVASTLDLVDFTKTAAYDMNVDTGAISQFNQIVGKNLPTQIKEYLAKKGFTGIGDVARNSDGNGYVIPATNADGVKMNVTLADTAITINAKKYYAAAADGIDDILTAASVTVKGTYAKTGDDFVAVTATPVSGGSYTTGYFKVSLDGTPIDVAALTDVTATNCAAEIVGKDSDGDIYVNEDGTVQVKLSLKADATKTVTIGASNGKFVVANTATGGTNITVAPTTKTALSATDVTVGNDAVKEFTVTVTLSDVADATKDATLKFTLSDS